jgi:hypothetical protein
MRQTRMDGWVHDVVGAGHYMNQVRLENASRAAWDAARPTGSHVSDFLWSSSREVQGLVEQGDTFL